MHKDRETSFYTQGILYPNETWIFHYVLLRPRRSNICWNITSSDLNANDSYGNNRWSRFRPIHRSRILTHEVLLPSSYRTSFSCFSRCTGSSVKVTVARMERTDGASVAYSRRCRGERRNSKLASKIRGQGPREGSWKKNTTNTRRRILHTGWIVFPWGEKERVWVNGARYLRAGIDSLRESFRWCTVTAS